MYYEELIVGSLSFDEIISEGRKSLDAGLYRITLIIALMVPGYVLM